MKSLRSIGAWVFPNSGFYGWIIVGVGFLCSMLSSPGQSFALSLYLEPLMADLGVTRLELSSLFAAATLAAATCLPFVGGLADRTTGRKYLSGILGLMGLAFLFFSRVQSTLALGIAFFTLRLLGQGAIGLGTLTITVRWFRRYRGRALAMVSLGYAFGEIAFPGTILSLIHGWGWRGSFVALAALYLLVFTPLVAWLTRERGEADGPLDGGPPEGTRTAADGGHPVEDMEASFTLSQTLRTPVFWGMLACVSVPPMLVTAVIFHQVALFEAQGWGAALVPASFMTFAISGVVTTYATGVWLERVPSRVGVSLSLMLMALAFATAALAPHLLPTPGAILYGGVLGLANGAAKSANALVWPSYFGIQALGAVKGVVNAARNGSTAFGPPLAAVLIGESGSFTPALLVFGTLATGSAIAALFLPEPTPVSAVAKNDGRAMTGKGTHDGARDAAGEMAGDAGGQSMGTAASDAAPDASPDTPGDSEPGTLARRRA